MSMCVGKSVSQSRVKSQESSEESNGRPGDSHRRARSTEHGARGTGHGTSNEGATLTQRASGPRYRNLRLVAGQVREVRMWSSEIDERWTVDCGKWREYWLIVFVDRPLWAAACPSCFVLRASCFCFVGCRPLSYPVVRCHRLSGDVLLAGWHSWHGWQLVPGFCEWSATLCSEYRAREHVGRAICLSS